MMNPPNGSSVDSALSVVSGPVGRPVLLIRERHVQRQRPLGALREVLGPVQRRDVVPRGEALHRRRQRQVVQVADDQGEAVALVPAGGEAEGDPGAGAVRVVELARGWCRGSWPWPEVGRRCNRARSCSGCPRWRRHRRRRRRPHPRWRTRRTCRARWRTCRPGPACVSAVADSSTSASSGSSSTLTWLTVVSTPACTKIGDVLAVEALLDGLLPLEGAAQREGQPAASGPLNPASSRLNPARGSRRTGCRTRPRRIPGSRCRRSW